MLQFLCVCKCSHGRAKQARGRSGSGVKRDEPETTLVVSHLQDTKGKDVFLGVRLPLIKLPNNALNDILHWNVHNTVKHVADGCAGGGVYLLFPSP